MDIITTPVGNVMLSLTNDGLLGLSFTQQKASSQLSEPAKVVAKELAAYFKNPHTSFTTALILKGTPFQQKVWHALQNIPCGKTLTYGELAHQLNTSPRAIGNACRTNPIPIIVPCHRVVGQKGLVGYSGETTGAGIKTKAFLLDHESI